jgi:hypothetical protein
MSYSFNLISDMRSIMFNDQRFGLTAARLRSGSTLGVKGVSRYDGVRGVKYRSGIAIEGMRQHLGSFDTIEEAQDAYRVAAEFHFGDFARVA